MVSNQTVKRIELLDGRFEIVPGSIVLLNPELEGERARLWAVWAYEADAPCDIDGVLSGRGLGPLMGYFSDREDLWKFGQHKPARFIDAADAEDCRSQAFELQELALDLLDREDATGGKMFVIAWGMFDMFASGPMPVGTSFPMSKSGGE